VSNENNSS